MPVRFHLNYRVPESERLKIAILFSLILHALLLFFIRFSQPSWENPASHAISLNVILEKKVAEVSKPAGISEVSQDSKGDASVGVQDANIFPQKNLTAVTLEQVDQPKTKIPQKFTSKKILAINKPSKITVVESEPDLLVIKSPPPETPENEEKSFAPTPSVDKAVATAVPSIEKLVSSEPTPGERQEKIVIAESVQEKLTVEKPGSGVEEPKPVKIKEPEPVKIEEQKPVKIKEPEPVKIEEPKPINVEEPRPAKIKEPESAIIEEPKAARVEELKPLNVGRSEPVKVAEPKPDKAEKPALTEAVVGPNIWPSEGGKSDVFRKKSSGIGNPSLAELSFASIRKIPGGEDRKIKFGERRKTVEFKERELRYALYIEGVRIKLERIGFFNYPAAAARDSLGGTLSIKISIRSDGSLEDFSVVRPSIHEALNVGAEKIVRMSAPFSPLPDDIKKEVDILSITINWTFSNSRQSLD